MSDTQRVTVRVEPELVALAAAGLGLGESAETSYVIRRALAMVGGVDPGRARYQVGGARPKQRTAVAEATAGNAA